MLEKETCESADVETGTLPQNTGGGGGGGGRNAAYARPGTQFAGTFNDPEHVDTEDEAAPRPRAVFTSASVRAREQTAPADFMICVPFHIQDGNTPTVYPGCANDGDRTCLSLILNHQCSGFLGCVGLPDKDKEMFHDLNEANVCSTTFLPESLGACLLV